MDNSTMRSRLLLALFLFAAIPCVGQGAYNYTGRRFNPYLDRFSLSLGAGLSAYNGDLSNFFEPKFQRYYLNPGVGGAFAYRFLDYLSFKGETNFFNLSSESDPIPGDSVARIFWSYNLDYFVAAVFDFIPQKKIDGLYTKWNGSLSAGIGQVIFFPRDNVAGGNKIGEILSNSSVTQYDYARLSVIYTLGASAKYFLNKNQYISLEGTYRFTRTDFMDAFKINGSPFDKYVTLQFRYTIIFDSTPQGIFDYEKYRKIHGPGRGM